MLRSKIRKLTAELSDYKMNHNTKDERIIINDIWERLRTNDDKAIVNYESFGPTARHRIMNINEYRHGFVLGFEDFEFGEYNWIKRVSFLNIEKVALMHPKDKNGFNYYTLGQTPNGSWGFGYRYTFGGGAGGGSGLSVFGDFFSSKEKCTTAALKFYKNKFEYAVLQNDTTNYKVPYCQYILNMINEKLKPKLDFSVNKKGQILLF